MRRSERRIDETARLEEIISRAEVLRIAFGGDEPYIIPVNFGYENATFYIHSASEGTKIDRLKDNPKAAFELEGRVSIEGADTSCSWTCRFESITGTGNLEAVTDDEEKLKGLNLIMAQYGGPQNSFNPAILSKTLVIKLKILEMTGKSNIPV